jgi:hypothetical protein
MEQGHRAIKIARRRLVARCGEVNLSQPLAIPMLMLLRHSTRGNEHQKNSRDEFFPVQWRFLVGVLRADTANSNHNESRDHIANESPKSVAQGREILGCPLTAGDSHLFQGISLGHFQFGYRWKA